MTNYDSYYKLRQVYYKLWQLLQFAKIIANYDRTTAGSEVSKETVLNNTFPKY